MKRKLAVMTVVEVSIFSIMIIMLISVIREERIKVTEIPVIESEQIPIEVEVQEPEKVYYTYIDKEYIEYAEEISEIYNVCPELIFSIIEHESSGNPNAKNGNCLGLMQVSEKWHQDRMERLGVESLFDPYGNILVATDYLVELFERYGDVDMVLMTYNGSSDAKERWDNGTPTKYATSVIERSMELEMLHGK